MLILETNEEMLSIAVVSSAVIPAQVNDTTFYSTRNLFQAQKKLNVVIIAGLSVNNTVKIQAYIKLYS